MRNLPLITAKTVEEFGLLQTAYMQLPSPVRANVESISLNHLGKPEFRLKISSSSTDKIPVSGDMHRVEYINNTVKIFTGTEVFISPVPKDGFELSSI